jgi:hypothetical protein
MGEDVSDMAVRASHGPARLCLGIALLLLIAPALTACAPKQSPPGPWELYPSEDGAQLSTKSGQVHLWCHAREIDVVFQNINARKKGPLLLRVGRETLELEASGMGGACYWSCVAGNGRWTDALSSALASGERLSLSYGRTTVAPTEHIPPAVARDFLALCDREPADG